MTKSLMTAILLLCASSLLTNGSLAGRRTPTPVTSTIQDLRPDNLPYLIHSDAPLSGTNVYRNNVDSVISQFQSSPQEWELSSLSSPTRLIFVDFSSPVPGSITDAPFASAYVAGRFVTKCLLLYPSPGPNGNIAVGNMTGLDSTLPCPLLFRFDVNGTIYRVRMDQQNYPGTDNALATCTGVLDPLNPSTSPCNAWTITPAAINGGTDNGQPRNVTELVKVSTVKGKTVEQHLGYYYMTFKFGITKP